MKMKVIILFLILLIITLIECKSSLYYSMIDDYEKGIDYYKVLNVSSNSNYNEIKKSFRKLSLKYHPDRNPEKTSHDVYILLSQAHSVLVDDESRKEWDDLLAYGIPMHEKYYGRYAYKYTGSTLDVRYILIILIILITILKYWYQLNRHNKLYKLAKETDRYKKRLKEVNGDESQINLVIDGAEKPDKFKSLFILQLFIFYPYKLLSSIYTFIFINKFKFKIKTQEEKEEEYRISIGLSKQEWELEKKREAERLEKFKQSGKYKRYIRSKNK